MREKSCLKTENKYCCSWDAAQKFPLQKRTTQKAGNMNFKCTVFGKNCLDVVFHSRLWFTYSVLIRGKMAEVVKWSSSSKYFDILMTIVYKIVSAVSRLTFVPQFDNQWMQISLELFTECQIIALTARIMHKSTLYSSILTDFKRPQRNQPLWESLNDQEQKSWKFLTRWNFAVWKPKLCTKWTKLAKNWSKNHPENHERTKNKRLSITFSRGGREFYGKYIFFVRVCVFVEKHYNMYILNKDTAHAVELVRKVVWLKGQSFTEASIY